jgi:lysophospholipase L1-like esterase
VSASRRRRATAALELAALALLTGVMCARPPTRVLVLGDSITAGISSRPRGPGYADLLQSRLGPEFQVVKLGCNGSTTREWQPHAPPFLCREDEPPMRVYASARALLPADVATILLGTNDLRVLEPIEPDAYRDGLRTLAESLHADGARDVMLISPPISIVAAARLAGYRARLRELCQERPYLHCGPDLVEVLDPAADFQPRDVHPNASGHEKIAAALAKTLRGLTAPRRAPRAPRAGRRRSRSLLRPRAPRGLRSRT